MNISRAMSRVLVVLVVVVMSQTKAAQSKFVGYCRNKWQIATFTVVANSMCKKDEHGKKAFIVGTVVGLRHALQVDATAKSVVGHGALAAVESYASTRVIAEVNKRGYDREWVKGYVPAF